VTHPHASWFPGLAAALSLAVVSASAAQQRTAPALTLEDVIQRAVAATASFERTFAAVVADEHLVQRDQRGMGRSLSRREMRSDLLLVRVPGQDGWLPFRDVYEVDGRAVRNRTERLQKLFVDAPQTAVGAGTQITNESSRYNIGRVIRTIKRSDIRTAASQAGVSESLRVQET
jgi:hypothetical protein